MHQNICWISKTWRTYYITYHNISIYRIDPMIYFAWCDLYYLSPFKVKMYKYTYIHMCIIMYNLMESNVSIKGQTCTRKIVTHICNVIVANFEIKSLLLKSSVASYCKIMQFMKCKRKSNSLNPQKVAFPKQFFFYVVTAKRSKYDFEKWHLLEKKKYS